MSEPDTRCDPRALARHLVPSLPIDAVPGAADAEDHAPALVEACWRTLSMVVPFSPAERAFLDLLFDHGQIRADVLTDDGHLQHRIEAQPLLAWKALNVRKHKGRAS